MRICGEMMDLFCRGDNSKRVTPVSDTVIDPSPLYLFLWSSQQTVSAPNMMPAAKGMSQMMLSTSPHFTRNPGQNFT